jgi:hypothetical protein
MNLRMGFLQKLLFLANVNACSSGWFLLSERARVAGTKHETQWRCSEWAFSKPANSTNRNLQCAINVLITRGLRGERSMKAKCLAGGLLLVAFATPALADSYYVVQDSATKKCTVVTQQPTTTTTTVVGGDKVYTSQTEAEGAMKTITVCK